MRYLILLLFINSLFAFNIETVDDTIVRKKGEMKIAKDGKPIYSAMEVPIIKSKVKVISAMQVPIIYAEGQKKIKLKKKYTPKVKKIDKTKHFTKKESLTKQKVKTEKIVVEEGAEFFNTINKSDNKPVDIE